MLDRSPLQIPLAGMTQVRLQMTVPAPVVPALRFKVADWPAVPDTVQLIEVHTHFCVAPKAAREAVAWAPAAGVLKAAISAPGLMLAPATLPATPMMHCFQALG